jgi:hypothetical protein
MPDTSRLTPGVTHGKVATYSKGCRCDACRARWTEYRREPNRIRRQRIRAAELATHPEGCQCKRCRNDRGE